MALFIGLMSGTSLDGVDGVLVEFAHGPVSSLAVVAHRHAPFAETLREELLALNRRGDNEIHRAALAGNALARSYAALVEQMLADSGRVAAQVRAIGAHGQTVRHRPHEFDGIGYTVQLLNGALLAELCAIDVVCDLRSRDLAAGGQAAPLTPAFHQARFASVGESVAVLNLGGIGNLTLLGADGTVRGFDCGPGNALLDAWCQRHRGSAYDTAGRWAASGKVHASLLALLLAEPFFALPPPKSTGRDLFNADWLHAALAHSGPTEAVDVQATLAELTVSAAADALRRHSPDSQRLFVCGGGAFNDHLMNRLAQHLPAVDSTNKPPKTAG
jgi:anhydro-N-acetylmuramic acid kinase